ncbi:hypothetical protein [Streptomyces mirabilis]
MVSATTVLVEGVKGKSPLPALIGAVVVAVCLGAMTLLGRATERMRGESV